jgi:hypothetical protein
MEVVIRNGMKILVSKPVEKEVKVDWFIVEEK